MDSSHLLAKLTIGILDTYQCCTPELDLVRINILAHWPSGLECSPMVQETWVQSQVASYQRL